MKKVPQRQKGLTITGTVGEFASLTAEANYGLKPCLGMGGGGGGGQLPGLCFYKTMFNYLRGHISRIGELGQWPVYSLPDTGLISCRQKGTTCTNNGCILSTIGSRFSTFSDEKSGGPLMFLLESRARFSVGLFGVLPLATWLLFLESIVL